MLRACKRGRVTGRHRRSGRHRSGTSSRRPRPRSARPAPVPPRRRGGRRLALVATVSAVLLGMSTSSLGTEAYYRPPPDSGAPGSVLRLPRIPELRIPPIPTTAASRATVVADIQPAETRALTHEARPAGSHAQGTAARTAVRAVASTTADETTAADGDETTTATRTSSVTPTPTTTSTTTTTTTTAPSADPPPSATSRKPPSTTTEVTTTSGRRGPPRSCDTTG
jgi:hypothetical protein